MSYQDWSCHYNSYSHSGTPMSMSSSWAPSPWTCSALENNSFQMPSTQGTWSPACAVSAPQVTNGWFDGTASVPTCMPSELGMVDLQQTNPHLIAAVMPQAGCTSMTNEQIASLLQDAAANECYED